jgi:hypothetical protein
MSPCASQPEPADLGLAKLICLAENELKRASESEGAPGPAVAQRAARLGLGAGGWVPGGGLMRGRYLTHAYEAGWHEHPESEDPESPV